MSLTLLGCLGLGLVWGWATTPTIRAAWRNPDLWLGPLAGTSALALLVYWSADLTAVALFCGTALGAAWVRLTWHARPRPTPPS